MADGSGVGLPMGEPMVASQNDSARKQKRVFDRMAERAVQSYLLALEASSREHPPSNVILGLIGPSGCGKSKLAEWVARALGFDPMVTTGARYMDKHENGAWEKFKVDGREAIERGRKAGRRPLQIVHDIDRGNFAERGNEEGTTNRSGLIGNQQGFADAIHGGRAEPHGLIMTLNNRDVIPEALQRSGRMRLVVMDPGWFTRRAQLLSLVGDERSARLAAELIMLRWPRAPIATLAAAVGIAGEEDLLADYEAVGGDMEAFRARARVRRGSPVKAGSLLRAMRQLSARQRSKFVSLSLAVKTKVRNQLAGRLEWIALGFMSAAQGLGCRGETLQLLVRAIGFQLCSEIVIRALDEDGIMVGEHRMYIDYQRFAIECDGCPEVSFDPRRSPHEQVSRALGRWINSLNRQWMADGAVTREIAVVFSDDVNANEDRLNKARAMLGVSPATSDWGDYEPVTIGSMSPASLRETRHTTRVRGRRR